MDGNFKMALHVYTKAYVIRVKLVTSAVSCVYALMCGKHQSVYKELFQCVLNKCCLQVRKVFTDFEMVVI